MDPNIGFEIGFKLAVLFIIVFLIVVILGYVMIEQKHRHAKENKLIKKGLPVPEHKNVPYTAILTVAIIIIVFLCYYFGFIPESVRDAILSIF